MHTDTHTSTYRQAGRHAGTHTKRETDWQRLTLEVFSHFLDGAETAETQEWCQCNGHLRLVVGVLVQVRALFVQKLCMDLRQGTLLVVGVYT